MTHLRAIMAFTHHSVLSKASSLASIWSRSVLNVHLIRSLCTTVPPLSAVKRGRGRPRRSELTEDAKSFSVESGVDLIIGSVPSLDEVYNETIQDAIEPTTPIVKRGRGRPKRTVVSIEQDGSLLNAAVSSSTDALSLDSKQTSTPIIPGLAFTHVDSSFTGRSTETSPAGIEYTGWWVNGKPHGVGQLVWPDGTSFEGHFVCGIRSGPGTLVKKWGIMSGNWVDDELEGEGEMVIIGGTIYKGNFHKTRRHGQGVLHYPNGTFYEGEHANGKREGHGKCTLLDGSILTGEWKEDHANGEGTLVFPNGKKLCVCFNVASENILLCIFVVVSVVQPDSLDHGLLLLWRSVSTKYSFLIIINTLLIIFPQAKYTKEHFWTEKCTGLVDPQSLVAQCI